MFSKNLLVKHFALATTLLLLTSCDDKQTQTQSLPPVEVSTATIESQRAPLFTELPGRTSAARVAEVRPQVNGIIQKRLFEEGSDVQAGQQLYQIDPSLYQATLQSAQADLAKNKANLKSIAAKASRYAELIKVKAVSQQDYDDAQANNEQAKALILSSEAAVETARITLDYTKVYAPIAGHIGKSSVTEGALVTSDQATSLATITQLDPIYVDVNQSSSELLQLRAALKQGKLQSGDSDTTKVTLSIDGSTEAYAGQGKLQFSDVTVDPSTGAVQLRALFPNPDHTLLPGLFVRARLEQGSSDNAILVPQKALVRTPTGGAKVWIVGQDNKVEERPVEVGRAVGDKWLITNGLQAGEKVVTEGLQKIHAGVEVRLAAAPEQPASQH